MNHFDLERKLKNHIKKRRIVEIIFSIVFFIIAISFMIAYEQSRTVEEVTWGPIKQQSVTYNQNLAWGILVGWLGFIPSVITLIVDFVSARLVTIEVAGSYITFYRGLFHINLYVNGEFKDGLTLFGYHLETKLPDGIQVNVALGKWSAHLSFSNGHPSKDV